MEFINELSRWCHRKLSAKTGLLVTRKSSAKTTLVVDFWNRQRIHSLSI
jgi:hypothetical protein